MALIRWEPLRELESLNQQLRHFLNEPEWHTLFNWSHTYVPRVDITEDEKNLYLTAEIPGAEKNDVKVHVENNVLKISGEKKKETVQKNGNYYREARTYGEFTRSLVLPAEVDESNIEANFKDGVLKIKMPKLITKSTGKIIEIK